MNQSDILRIAIADDHPLFRNAMKNTFQKRRDFSVVGDAENGKQLMDLLEIQATDIAIVDLQMPVMDGLETTRAIRQKHPGLKVIISGMHNEAEIILQTLEAGANAYVHKESGSAEMCQAIMALKHTWFYNNRTVAEALIRVENNINPIRLPELSEKDKRLLSLLCVGHTEDQIARILELRPKLVKAYIEKLIHIHRVKTKEELILLNM